MFDALALYGMLLPYTASDLGLEMGALPKNVFKRWGVLVPRGDTWSVAGASPTACQETVIPYSSLLHASFANIKLGWSKSRSSQTNLSLFTHPGGLPFG